MSQWLPYPWQLDVWAHLDELQKRSRLPHALLINGEKGSGKIALVKGLVNKLLCMQPGEFACGQCKSCLLYGAGTHPDYVHIALEEKSKVIKVDQIRSAVEFIGMTSQMGGMKIIVIEEAERMNPNAANALLKCLEEPLGSSLLVLVSDAPRRLLPTIRSRCQSVVLPEPDRQQAESWLATFIPERRQREKLLMLSNGNPLMAMEFLDKEVLELFDGFIEKLLALRAGSGSVVKFAEGSKDMDIALWLAINQKIISLMIRQSLDSSAKSTVLDDVLATLATAKGFTKKAYAMLDEIQQAIREVQGTSNPDLQLLVECLLIRWQALLRA